MRHTRLPGESADYLAAREELRLAETDLMRHRERVAAQRRALPPGPAVDDYVFVEGPADLDAGDEPVREVSLSGLFTAPDRPLIVYHLMYGKKQTEPCPMCTLWIDGYNGIAHHIVRNIDFAIAAAADPPALRLAPAEAAELRRQHVQIRPRQRGRGRRAGLDPLRLHPGPRRNPSPFLLGPPPPVRRHRPARHRPARPRLAPARPHPAGPRRLVAAAGLLSGCRARARGMGAAGPRRATGQAIGQLPPMPRAVSRTGTTVTTAKRPCPATTASNRSAPPPNSGCTTARSTPWRPRLPSWCAP